MMDKVDISDADVINAIRTGMPVASNSNKGLMPANYISKVYATDIEVDCNSLGYNTTTICHKVKNGPGDGILGGYFYIETSGYSRDWMRQVITNVTLSGMAIHVRGFYNGTSWSSWQRII